MRFAVAADVHEMALRRRRRLVVAEYADLEAHAALAEVRHAQAAMHGVGKRNRAEILAAGFHDETDRAFVHF